MTTAMTLKPQRVDTTNWCPVCNEKRTDAQAIARHNDRCARYGERLYRGPNR